MPVAGPYSGPATFLYSQTLLNIQYANPPS